MWRACHRVIGGAAIGGARTIPRSFKQVKRPKSRPAQPRAGPDTDAPEGRAPPPGPGWPPGAPHRPKRPPAPPPWPAGAGGRPFLRPEPFFSGRRAESRRRRGRRPASGRPSGAGGRVGTPPGRGDRWGAVGGAGPGVVGPAPPGAGPPRFRPPKIALFEAPEIPPSAAPRRAGYRRPRRRALTEPVSHLHPSRSPSAGNARRWNGGPVGHSHGPQCAGRRYAYCTTDTVKSAHDRAVNFCDLDHSPQPYGTTIWYWQY